jgi:hypothetical protein
MMFGLSGKHQKEARVRKVPFGTFMKITNDEKRKMATGEREIDGVKYNFNSSELLIE